METATPKKTITVELTQLDFETLIYLMEFALKDNVHTPESRTKLQNMHDSFKQMHHVTKSDAPQRPTKTN